MRVDGPAVGDDKNLGMQPVPCLSHIELEFDDTLGFEDDANAFLACGRFLVLGAIALNPGFS
jgi:hypothetical protein